MTSLALNSTERTESRKAALRQFMKFFVTGVLNTAIDFALLDILLLIFKTGSNDKYFLIFKAVAYFAALINSYFFNKYWVFAEREASMKTSHARDGVLFVLVSAIGFAINIGIATFVFNLIHTHNTLIAADFAALVGTAAVLLWNFAGYKFFVFTPRP